MELQATTTYALQILLYLHQHKGALHSAARIANHIGGSDPLVTKIADRLREKGLIQATRGRLGGYKLGKSTHEISVYDIFSCFEGERQLSGISLAGLVSDAPMARLYRVETMEKKVHMIPVDEIILIQPSPQQGILELHRDDELLEFRGRISRVVVNVPELFRSHMSVVVNINHITDIDVEKREIELTNGQLVPIAKQKIPVLSRLMATATEGRAGVNVR